MKIKKIYLGLKSIKLFFILSIISFLLIIAPMFIDLFRIFPVWFMFFSWILYSFSGFMLIKLTLKKKIKGKIKKFLLITGFSSFGFFIFVVLHNLFYALEILLKKIAFLSILMGFLHGLFFIIAVLICPLLFMIGLIGTFVTIKKKI